MILSVDGISLFEQSLQYSIALLRDVENKPVELFVDRNGEELTFLMRRVEMEIDGQKGELMDSLYINDSIHVVRKIVKMDSVTKKKVHDKAPLDVEIVSMDKKEIIFDIRSSGLLKVNFVPANGDNQYKIYEENVYAGLGKIHLHGKKKPQGVFYIVFEQSGKIKSFSPSF